MSGGYATMTPGCQAAHLGAARQVARDPGASCKRGIETPSTERERGRGGMALSTALGWRIGGEIECISVYQDLRLHGDGMTDSLHNVTTVFGIANQSG
jgi:hypothetical protein